MAYLHQKQYLAQWHEGFVGYIGTLRGVIAGLMARPEARREASHEQHEVLEHIKMILMGREVEEVEQDLAAGIVRKSTLDKIEKINGDLADACLAHIPMAPLVREFWKQMVHIQIAQNKRAEEMRLNALQIPIIEDQ